MFSLPCLARHKFITHNIPTNPNPATDFQLVDYILWASSSYMGCQKWTLLLDPQQTLTNFSLHFSLIDLTYKDKFIRNFVRILYKLMVQNRQIFNNEGFNLCDKINICSEIVTAYT